jgi:NTP pyrophosphatase (non-canonical NTP hydrolase)
MNTLEQRIKQFADGRWPHRDIPGRIRKLGEEFGELAEAVIHMRTMQGAKDTQRETLAIHCVALEAADCAIILADLCSLLGISLETVMLEKLEIIERRPQKHEMAPVQ